MASAVEQLPGTGETPRKDLGKQRTLLSYRILQERLLLYAEGFLQIPGLASLEVVCNSS